MQNYKTIQLSQNKLALVDIEDFDRVNKFKWYFCMKSPKDNTGYAVHDFRKYPEIVKRYGSSHISLHRFILNPPRDKQIDHINGDGIDNRKINLRVCTNAQNSANKPIRKTSKNTYKGIEKSTMAERWFARIRVSGKSIYLGCFKTPKEAARAYNHAAIQYFGEYAYLNNI